MPVILGDCLEVMKRMDAESVDAIVTDPPYALTTTARWKDDMKFSQNQSDVGKRFSKGFMGKEWDGKLPGIEVWQECLRVVKPGAHMLAFGGTRTHHRLMCNIEDAGWEIRDVCGWLYGSGFPKSLNISKALDKAAGKTSEDIQILKDELILLFENSGLTLSNLNASCGFEASGYLRKSSTWKSVLPSEEKWWKMREVIGCEKDLSFKFKEIEREIIGVAPWSNSINHFVPGEDHTQRIRLNITAPTTDIAKRFSGWGTHLKPAWEPIILCRKPLEGTVAQNVLKYSVGGINLDGCRVEYLNETDKASATPQGNCTAKSGALAGGTQNDGERAIFDRPEQKGRFPSNLIIDDSEEVRSLFPNTKSGKMMPTQIEYGYQKNCYGKRMEHMTMETYGDSGSAARFFYCAKASRSERGVDNKHPTVKPLSLMRYLCRLITPPGGIVLDPFGGSGSTGVAAKQEGFQSILIELEQESYETANARMRNCK